MTDPITQSMMQGAAGAAGGATYVNDVFNLDIYKGKSGVGIAITNGMDYTKPSMVVIKNRERASKAWWIYDNEADIKPDGGQGNIFWNSNHGTDIGYSSVYNITRNATGYVSPTTDDNELGANGDYYVSYSFKKTKNFFDIVPYTGTGSLRTIAHNLGAVPAMIWVKQYGADNQDWRVYHKDMNSNGPVDSSEYVMKLNTNIARTAESAAWNNTPPTATHFTVNTGNAVNQSGQKYVAYLFADHNAGNTGTFGEDGDQNIIACGRYTGNGAQQGTTVNLGWEPDWLMIKRRDYNENWYTSDQMQQMPGPEWQPSIWMKMDTTDTNQNNSKVRVTSSGFALTDSDAMINASGNAYIYCAIRRPELTVARPIESPTEVLGFDNSQELSNAGFPCFPVRSVRKVDFATARQYNTGESWYTSDRKMGRDNVYLNTSNGIVNSNNFRFDILHGWNSGWQTVNYQTWAWARNPGSFDIQYHYGNGSNLSPYHRLGVVPEMIWCRRMDNAADWGVYHFGCAAGVNPEQYYLQINEQQGQGGSAAYWDNTAPTATQFTVGSGGQTNASNNWIASYLFASKEGVSKLGWYTGNGATQSLTFGFQPRLVLIKCTSHSNTKWALWDSMRGWNQCMDLSQTAGQTNFQAFTVDSTGITLSVGNGNSNDSGRNYIYYAHA